MDQDKVLKELRETCELNVRQYEMEEPDIDVTDGEYWLSVQFLKLDSWIADGGALPEEWGD